MAIVNTRQITKSNNKTKLIEFNDMMQGNDFSEISGVMKSSVHSKFSRIRVTIVDWTNGKGESAVVVNHNITPITMKTIAELVLSGNTEVFEQTDKYSKRPAFLNKKLTTGLRIMMD